MSLKEWGVSQIRRKLAHIAVTIDSKKTNILDNATMNGMKFFISYISGLQQMVNIFLMDTIHYGGS
jgi:hypothetical protein